MLNKIVWDKKAKTILLRDEKENLIFFGKDDKTVCDLKSLHVVCEVLSALGYNMQPDDDIDANDVWVWSNQKGEEK